MSLRVFSDIIVRGSSGGTHVVINRVFGVVVSGTNFKPIVDLVLHTELEDPLVAVLVFPEICCIPHQVENVGSQEQSTLGKATVGKADTELLGKSQMNIVSRCSGGEDFLVVEGEVLPRLPVETEIGFFGNVVVEP